MENIQLLKQMELFSNLDPLEMIQVNKRIKTRPYKMGDLVLTEGGLDTGMFVVKSGQFRAFVERDGQPQDLAVFTEGEHFGELAITDGKPRSASVAAMMDGVLLELTQKNFQGLLQYSNKLREHLLENLVRDLVQKIRRTNDRLLQLL